MAAQPFTDSMVQPAYSFRTTDLAVGYRGKALIEEICVDVLPGTVLALIGPNGAGKSTILKTIAKYLATIAGTIYIDGHSIVDLSNKDLARQVAVVLTDRLKAELMTCEDIVATGRYPHTGHFGILSQTDRRIVKRSMKLLHAWELRHQDFREVSDGQRQRILIARALAQEPRIIVLDEPTAYLDVRYKLELLTILRQMAKESDITVIMSLHELDMAQKVADFVMCVKGDRIAHFGTPQELFVNGQMDTIFELEHGTYDPLFGSLEFSPTPGKPQVFVIAGDGTGVPTYRILQQRGIPFATGILHRNDVDYHVGVRLTSTVFAEDSFEPISTNVYSQALDCLQQCRVVVDCLTSHGSGNIMNRTLVDEAQRLNIPVSRDVLDVVEMLAQERRRTT